jgi:hypothetical protein
MHRKIASAVTEKTGMNTVEWVQVQTGRSEAAKLRFKAKVEEMFAKNPSISKIIVLSCFAGLSGRAFLERLTRGVEGGAELSQRLVGCEGWNAHPALIDHLAQVAVEGGSVAGGLKKAVELEADEKTNHPPYNPPFYLTKDRP